ncbi:hypothetical protein RD792_000663 [Penstemon davidsonii]|uniref:Methyltransferase-like protein 1 n=1 Tax=Penstemon davidsonii TaxID=160366 RepID=A0ABR0DLA6_9LAMI|nr:hypothetical protein RD792_000663 [Penstemon davidsonii]
MGSPEHRKSLVKRDIEEDLEVNIDIVRDDDDWDGDDKRKHRSSKLRKPGSDEEADGLDGSGRKRNMSDRHESRKRMGGSSRADSDRDDYEARRESRSKQVKKIPEENTLDKLSTWYQDGEADYKFDGGDKSGNRRYSQAEENERKKPISKYAEHNVEGEKVLGKDSGYSVRKEYDREKGNKYAAHGRNSRRRWDEPDSVDKADVYVEDSDVRRGKPADPTFESASARERSDTLETKSTDLKIRGIETINDEGITSHDKEERRVDSVRSKSGRSEALDIEKNLARDDGSSKERYEEYRQPRNPSLDVSDRSLNADEDGNMGMRDKSRSAIESSNKARTPEKIGNRQYESDTFEMDYERSSTFRLKEQGKDGSWDDRSKRRDDSWGDRNKDKDNFKDTSMRRQDKETRGGDMTYDNSRDWELPRRGHDRIDGDRPHGRFGGRKDGSRTEAVKTSSKYGISNENYDVIEIQTKTFDYGRDDSTSVFARNSETIQQSDTQMASDFEEFSVSRESRSRSTHGYIQSGGDTKDRSMDGGLSMQDQHSWRDNNDFQADKSSGQKGDLSNHGIGSSSGPIPPHGNQEIGPYSRNASQGGRGNRFGRVGRGRPTGRDNQQAGFPISLVGSPFGPLGLPPPGALQSLNPNMSPATGPPISPGVFIPQFQPPIMWPGARGAELNMLGLPPAPNGPLGPRFLPNLGNHPSGALIFSSSGQGRGISPNMSSSNFNEVVPVVRGQPQDRASGGWFPPKTNGPPGKAPSRGEQNDYSQNFVDTGMRPQNFIRELELTSVVEDYPKLRELIQRKDEIVSKSASPPMYYKCDLREHALSPEFFGTKFDVILVDPPWEEYVHRAPGVTDNMEHWTLEEIMNVKIEAIADTPSFIFLWVGDGVGLEQGRQCLKKWGFRRCEDICWVKTNKTTATPGLRHDSHTLFQRSKEHCLMGIKGTVRRSTDGHIIHANIDTDVIIAEEPPYGKGSTAKPEDMYRIIEHFSLGRRRLELFGEDHNIRSGWLTVGKGLSSSNFNSEAYIKSFADKDGKVWMGGGGRNPPPEAPHLVLTTPEIELLRPKSPMKNQQQQQQQSVSISLTSANSSSNKWPTPQTQNVAAMNQEASGSNILLSPAPWGAASMESSFKGDDRLFDMYNAPFG